MPAIKLEQFGGMLPAWDPHLLPTGQGAYSQNGFLFSGALTGWRKPKLLRALQDSTARVVYRIPTVSETQAVAYLVFVTQPTDGDQVVVGELTYTFVPALSGAQDVLIGTDTADTATNFALALTCDANTNTNAGIKYGFNTVVNGVVKYYTADVNVIPGLTDPQVGQALDHDYVVVGALDFGASFNLTNVSETTSNARLTWLYDLASLTHTTTTFYGGSNPTFDNRITGDAFWMEFQDPDTNVFRSPISEDQWNRYYWASPSTIPSYNTYDRIINGEHSWYLGVPPPGCAPMVAVTGGGNNLVLGNSLNSGSDVNGLGNYVYLMPITPTGGTSLTDIQFNLVDGGDVIDTAKWAGVLYDDDGGQPGSLMNTGEIQTGVQTTGNVSTFVNPSGLTQDTQYWIGIITDTQNPYPGGAGSMTKFAQTFTNGPPGTAPGGLTADQPGMQIWGDCLTPDIIEARAYVYTWVTEYGEEGPPSPATTSNGWSNGTWTIGLWQPPVDDLGIVRNLKKLRLYRTVTATGGSTVFFFVTELELGTAEYVDTITDDLVVLNEQMGSTTWFPPPENLQGFTVMQNGMVAAFIGNTVWFCEPFSPHAWPPEYVLTVDFPIVGLGVTNGALVVCTAAFPYVINGVSPSTLDMHKCSVADPCASRGSIVGGDQSVSYMSPNGLIQVTSAGVATNTTDLWFTREKWEQLTPPRYSRAIRLSSCYYCFGSVSPPSVTPVDTAQAQQGFTIELDQDNASFTIWPQPGGHRLGFNILSSPLDGVDITNILTDVWTGIGMMIAEGNVYYFDFSDPEPEMVPYTWKSKIYQQNTKRDYTAMKVFFTVPANTDQNDIRIEEDADDPAWVTLPDDSYGFLKTYVDVDGTGSLTLIDAREIRKSGELLRLVDGFKAEQWQWEVNARVVISNIQIATSAKELAGV